MKNSVGYKLGKAYGLMEKRMKECGINVDSFNLLYDMKQHTCNNMVYMFKLFHETNAWSIEADLEIAELFLDISEIPVKLSDMEYSDFWLGIFSNYAKEK
ncbi:MAG TPA: hypothetical protein DCS50_00985 [Acidaminococcaceae bacterium]|jgi:hypothetical protein|nr:hypothetical protein [Acidaminococcaceae bacterium]